MLRKSFQIRKSSSRNLEDGCSFWGKNHVISWDKVSNLKTLQVYWVWEISDQRTRKIAGSVYILYYKHHEHHCISQEQNNKILVVLSEDQPANPCINLWLGAVFSGWTEMVLYDQKQTLRYHHGNWWKAGTDSNYMQVCWRMPSLEYEFIYFHLYFPTAAQLTSIRTCEGDVKYIINGTLGDLAETSLKFRSKS